MATPPLSRAESFHIRRVHCQISSRTSHRPHAARNGPRRCCVLWVQSRWQPSPCRAARWVASDRARLAIPTRRSGSRCSTAGISTAGRRRSPSTRSATTTPTPSASWTERSRRRYDGYGGNYDVQFGHLYYDRPYSYYLRLAGVSVRRRAVPRRAGLHDPQQRDHDPFAGPATMPRDQNFPISVEKQYLRRAGQRTAAHDRQHVLARHDGGLQREARHAPLHQLEVQDVTRATSGCSSRRSSSATPSSSTSSMATRSSPTRKPRYAAGVVTGHDPAQLKEGQLMSSGFIALQAEGHPVDFRNVRLLESRRVHGSEVRQLQALLRQVEPGCVPLARTSRGAARARTFSIVAFLSNP